MQRDFTTGSIPKHVIYFSLPMFAGNILQALYNTVDSVWVGQFLGKGALGAVSVSFPLIMALLAMVMGLTMATTTLVAQYRGAGSEKMVRRTVSTSLLMLTAMGIIVSVLGVVFRYPLLKMIRTPEDILHHAANYFGIFMAGLLGMFLYNTLSAILRGLGDSHTPLKYMAVAAGLNVALDPLMIFGVGPLPRMEIAGAALATVISQAVSAVLMWRWLTHRTDLLPRGRSEWVWDRTLAGALVRIGFPAGLQQLAVSGAMLVVTFLINQFGTDVTAAFGAASRLDQFAFMPAMSIGLAVSALVGQNLGARKLDRVRSTVYWSVLLGIGITSLVSLVAILWPTLLLVLFTDEPAVLAEGSRYLRIMGWAYIPFALMFILSGVMRGAGDTVPAMVVTLLSLWGFRVPLAAYLSRSFGSTGIWLGIAISAFIGMLLQWGYYMTGRWQRRRLPSVPAGQEAAVQAN